MAQHGGYRAPRHPAPVSGPGRLARRTDGGPAQSISTVGDQAYGERKNQEASQRIAPMAGAEPLPKAATAAPSNGGAMPAYSGGDFLAPSSRPDEPVTAGVDAGPGPGPEALTFQPVGNMPTGYLTNMLAQMSATDTTGTLASLYEMARQRGV